ncbi:MAG: hypothetical protein AAFX04_00965 [Pseudomonadota bacterium]
MLKHTFAALAASALTMAPAQAQMRMSADTADDVDCIIALSTIDDGGATDDIETAAIYFFGKLNGRNPELDLEAAIRARFAALTDENASFEAIALECSAEVVEQGQYLESVGQALSE